MKNIQLKVVLIFLFFGIIIIAGIGFFTIKDFELARQEIAELSNYNIDEIDVNIEKRIEETKVIILYGIGVFSVLSILVGYYVSKSITRPISKLINMAENIAAGENIDTKLLEKTKNESEINDLSRAFVFMTEELQKNLKEATRQKKQIETILLHMTDGIIAFNMEGRIILINPAATRLLRLMPEDENLEKIFNEKLNIDINMEKTIYLEDWTSSQTNVTIGDTYVNIFFATFKDENDKASGIMAVIQDITEHVSLDNMRKEFVADVSHELKTPITSIMGYADTLLDDDYDKETETKFLNVIATEARRMARLVTDLLTLSRYDSNQIIIKKEDFDLGELVKKSQEKLQVEIDKKHQKVESLITTNVPKVYADKDGIERVILNILTNSIKYTPEGGKIDVYVGFVYNDAYIKIIDTGIGIPEEELSKIFERFYRVDKARTRQMGGTGLRIVNCQRNIG